MQIAFEVCKVDRRTLHLQSKQSKSIAHLTRRAKPMYATTTPFFPIECVKCLSVLQYNLDVTFEKNAYQLPLVRDPSILEPLNSRTDFLIFTHIYFRYIQHRYYNTLTSKENIGGPPF